MRRCLIAFSHVTCYVYIFARFWPNNVTLWFYSARLWFFEVFVDGMQYHEPIATPTSLWSPYPFCIKIRLHSLTGIPLSTIHDNLKRFEEGRGAEMALGSGRDRILKPSNKRPVTQFTLHHRGWSIVRIRMKLWKEGHESSPTEPFDYYWSVGDTSNLFPKKTNLDQGSESRSS